MRVDNVRGLFLNLWEPKENKNGIPTYGGCFLLPKKGNEKVIAELEKAVMDLAIENKLVNKNTGKILPSAKLPIHDGDEKMDNEGNPNELFAGCWYFNATSRKQPGIVDRNVKRIIDQAEVYSGAVYNVAINPFFFDNESKGISFGLNNIQKVKDGQRLGGGKSAEEEFTDLGNDEEDVW